MQKWLGVFGIVTLVMLPLWAQDEGVGDAFVAETLSERLARKVKEELDAKVDAELDPLVRSACKQLGVEYPVKAPTHTIAELDAMLEDKITEAIKSNLPPNREDEYKAEAAKLYGLTKVGEEVTLRTKLGTEVSGTLYDMEGTFVRISGRRIPKRDLEEESMAHFDPKISAEMQERYIRKKLVQDKITEERLREDKRETMKAPFYQENGYVHYKGRWVAAYDLINGALGRKRQTAELKYRDEIENQIYLSNGFVKVHEVWRPLEEVNREREELARRQALINAGTAPAAPAAAPPAAPSAGQPTEKSTDLFAEPSAPPAPVAPAPPPAAIATPAPAGLPMADLPPVDPASVNAAPVQGDLFEGPAIPLAPAGNLESDEPAEPGDGGAAPQGGMYQPDEDELLAMDVAKKQQQFGELVNKLDAGEEIDEDDLKKLGLEMGGQNFGGGNGNGGMFANLGMKALAIIGAMIMWFVGVAVSTVSLWLAGKFTGVTCSILVCLVASAASQTVSSVVSIFASWWIALIASTIVLFYILYKFSDANGYSDVFVQVVVAKVLVGVTLFALAGFVLSKIGMIGA